MAEYISLPNHPPGGFKKGDKRINRKAGPGRLSNRFKGAVKLEFLSIIELRTLKKKILQSNNIKVYNSFFWALWDRIYGRPVQPIEQRSVGPLEGMTDDMLLEARDRVDQELEARDKALEGKIEEEENVPCPTEKTYSEDKF